MKYLIEKPQEIMFHSFVYFFFIFVDATRRQHLFIDNPLYSTLQTYKEYCLLIPISLLYRMFEPFILHHSAKSIHQCHFYSTSYWDTSFGRPEARLGDSGITNHYPVSPAYKDNYWLLHSFLILPLY
ncbi:MAG: hypothetical protein EZS28_023641 [Streblomastix strix]|uniref:Uncharacterized protein n=1 Tax=Streblomastix strix TaxID=222440 RepID=A0A5J4VEH7_9EUKA|nr:MAG: hypothetical protein EZS28_023641 [Streblomastix strix]